MDRINTAGQIPKEAVSLNRDMVRTRTFNPMDLERVLSRPVCPATKILPFAYRLVILEGPTSGKHRSAQGLALRAPPVWSMRSFASAHRELRIHPD
jgi:hypothetical protein